MAKVTQSTIAKHLGVSRQAVGYALGLYTNSNIKLNPRTYDLIVQTAKELKYRPNRLAQIISGRKSGVIGVMSFGGITQMSAQNVLHVSKAIQHTSFQPMIYDVAWYQKSGIETVTQTLLDNRVEGIILISPTDWMPASVIENIRSENIPMVSIGGVYLNNVPHIESDHEKGVYELTNGLLDRGYRSLLYLTHQPSPAYGKQHPAPSIKRMDGFRHAIEERGGTVADNPIPKKAQQLCGEIFFSSGVSDWSDPYLAGQKGMEQVLASGRKPHAVLCGNDDWAAGALKACGRAGIRIPKDIAIAGNDGTVISNYGYVPLTTIIDPTEKIATTAIQVLEKLIRKEKISAKDEWQQISPTVVWRDSTDPK